MKKLALPAVRKVMDDDEIRQAEERQAAREKMSRADACFRRNGVPEIYRAANLYDYTSVPDHAFDSYREAQRQLARARTCPGIYALIGEIGAGKTHMACGLVNDFCSDGFSARYIKTADYIRDYRATWRLSEPGAEARFDQQFVSYRLLILDEWQVRGDTQSENILLLRLIDKRYEAGVTTVLIGNHASAEEFAGSIDARVADRIQDGGGVILCNWSSLRGRVRPN